MRRQTDPNDDDGDDDDGGDAFWKIQALEEDVQLRQDRLQTRHQALDHETWCL